MAELPEPDDERDRVTAQGHRLDGTNCTLMLVCHSSGAWTVYGLPYDMEYDEHGGGPGVRLTAAAMAGLCQAVLEWSVPSERQAAGGRPREQHGGPRR